MMFATNRHYKKRMRLGLPLLKLIAPAALLVGSLAPANASESGAESCWIDLDHDGIRDLAIFVPDDEGGRLIALLARGERYEGKTLMKGASGMVLSCKVGDQVTETTAVRLKGKTYVTRGSYIQFAQPEGAAYAFFWSGSEFQEVLLAD